MLRALSAGNACKRVTSCFDITSDWLRKWRDFLSANHKLLLWKPKLIAKKKSSVGGGFNSGFNLFAVWRPLLLELPREANNTVDTPRIWFAELNLSENLAERKVQLLRVLGEFKLTRLCCNLRCIVLLDVDLVLRFTIQVLQHPWVVSRYQLPQIRLHQVSSVSRIKEAVKATFSALSSPDNKRLKPVHASLLAQRRTTKKSPKWVVSRYFCNWIFVRFSTF